ncbi:AAA family ATPase [Streptomyces bobili]|uniref:AAA family ATPase n=1 Tax=Streptomyces bobili TaxID=67280 RepID=UPI0033B08906
MSLSAGQVRRLIVIAVSDYGDGDTDFVKGIGDQVAVVTGWLADPDLGPDRAFDLQEPPAPLHSVQQVRQFLACQDLAAAKRDEAVVVYITGHGQRGSSSGRHYLRFARTDDARLPGTALTTSEVISAALGSSAKHVLVLVDSCFAGALLNEVPAVARDLGPRRNLPSLAVVAAGEFDEQPLVGSFTELLNRALDKISEEEPGFAGPHLSFSDWRQVLDSVSRQDPGLVEARWVWPERLSEEASLCLPNPRYQRRHELGAAVRELPDAVGLFTDFWHDRASGRTHEQDLGWYFSGRHEAMRKLAGFVREGVGVMVVTGAAGSGKSALLARLVTLSDPTFLSQPELARLAAEVPADERPPSESVDAAVLARNKTSLGLIEDLLRALGSDAVPAGTAPLQVLLEHLSARARHGMVPTVVIDGLDEAQQTMACLNDVVLPMARSRTANGRPLVRVILGVRSSPPTTFGTQPRLRDADADALLDVLIDSLDDDRQRVPVQVQRTDEHTCEADIAAYVEALLSGGESSPYARDGDRARATGHNVARAVAPSFLDARLAADQLRTADQMQDITETAWQARLDQGTVALLHEDLHAVADHQNLSVNTLVRVMRATAFGAGSGLPWAEVWPAVAEALAFPATDPAGAQAYTAAIRAVQNSRLTGYLATSEEDGRTTYRPVHQQVAEVLLRQPSWLVHESPEPRGEQASLSLVSEQARITDALAALVPAHSAYPAHPYIRRHLVAHAAAGQVLDDDHVPIPLLAQETSHTLREQLGLPLSQDTPQGNLLSVTAAALIEPYLTADTDAASRHSSIALHRAALTNEDRAESDDPSSLLSPQWGWWESATNVLASLGEHVHVLTTIELAPERFLIAAGTKSGVHIWDASSGRHLTDLPAGFVMGMCPIRSNSGRIFLVTAGPQGVAIWDPLSGLQIVRTGASRATGVQVLADHHQRWQLFLRGDYPAVWKPDQNHVEFLSAPSSEESAWLRGPHAVVRGKEGEALLAAQGSGYLTLSSLDSGDSVAGLPFSQSGLRKLMGIRRPGRTDLVLAATSQHLHSWDPDTGQSLRVGTGPAAHPAQIPDNDGRVAIALERRGAVEVWELHDTAWQRTAVVSVGAITALTALPSEQGRWRVVTAGEAGVRVWHPAAATGPATHGATSPAIIALTTLRISIDNGPVGDLWAIGTTAGVEVTDLRGYRRRHLPTGRVHALHALPDGLLAVDTRTGIQVWDPSRDCQVKTVPPQQKAHNILGPPASTPASCLIDWPTGSLSVVSARSGGVQLYDVMAERVLFLPFRGADHLRAVSAVPSPDGAGPWIALGTRGRVLVWDLAAQQQVAELRIRGRSATRALAVVRTGDATLLAAATREEIHLWDTATWTAQVSFGAPWTKVLAPVPVSAARNLLASGSGHAVHFWDPTTAELLHTLVTAAPVEAITSLRDKDALLIGVGGPAGIAVLSLAPRLS